jgi:hypothetical protein
VYILVWDSPSGIHAYGPFEDKVEAFGWWRAKSAFIDQNLNRAVGVLLFSPVDKLAEPASPKLPGKLHHQNTDSDDQANGFILLVVVTEEVSFGVGLFPTRAEANQWFMDKRDRLDGSPGLILPMLSPRVASG